MVDRIKITTNNITCRNASNQVTFNTNNQYLKSDPNGVFKAGGILQAPIVYGTGLAADMNYGPLRSGYPIARQYNAGQSHTTNGAATTNYTTVTGRKGIGTWDRIITGVDYYHWVAFAVTTAAATNYAGRYYFYDGAFAQTNSQFWVPYVAYARLYNGTNTYVYDWYPIVGGVPVADGKIIVIVQGALNGSYWYDFTNSVDRTSTVQALNTLNWPPDVDMYLQGPPSSFGLEVV